MRGFLLTCCCFLLLAGLAHADLDGFLLSLNRSYQTDPDDYCARLSQQFGVSHSDVSLLLRKTSSAGDVFMIFQLGRMLGWPYDRVWSAYSTNQGRGWGVIAKEMGIKPGSEAFHALKRGDFVLRDLPGKSHSKFGNKQKGDKKYGHPGHGKGKEKK